MVFYQFARRYPIKIPDDDIIHLTTLSTDGLKGKPPIQIARESIGSSQAAQKFKGKFFTKGIARDIKNRTTVK